MIHAVLEGQYGTEGERLRIDDTHLAEASPREDRVEKVDRGYEKTQR